MFTGVIVIETAIEGGLTVGRQRLIVRGGGPGLGQETGLLNRRRVESVVVAGRESPRENVVGTVVGNASVIGIVIETEIVTGTVTERGMCLHKHHFYASNNCFVFMV